MSRFNLKTYRKSNTTKKPHFYILNKGLNSGKPLKKACPNCFIFTVNSQKELDEYYCLCNVLWQTKSFHYYLKGSVIPFITINDLRTALSEGFKVIQKNSKSFDKSVKTLKLLELKEKQFYLNIQLINDAKRAVFNRYSLKKG